MKVIKRENGSVDKIFFSLRFIDVKNEEVSRIITFLNGKCKIEVSPLNNDNELRILIIEELDTYTNYSKIIDTIAKFEIKKEQINFVISMTSEYDMSGFTIPKKISNLFCKTGGSIDFSLIILP